MNTVEERPLLFRPHLLLDLYEHAYHLDFGSQPAADVDVVMAYLYWQRIAARYQRAFRAPGRSWFTVLRLSDQRERRGGTAAPRLRRAGAEGRGRCLTCDRRPLGAVGSDHL